jgi:hypothetical protein
LAPATVVNVTIYPSVGVTQLRAFLKDCIWSGWRETRHSKSKNSYRETNAIYKWLLL